MSSSAFTFFGTKCFFFRMSYTVRFEWNDGPQALINQAHLFLESIALNYLSRKINWKMIAWLLNVARRKTQSLFRNEPA